MKFESVLVADAGVSGKIAKKRPNIRGKVESLALKMAEE